MEWQEQEFTLNFVGFKKFGSHLRLFFREDVAEILIEPQQQQKKKKKKRLIS